MSHPRIGAFALLLALASCTGEDPVVQDGGGPPTSDAGTEASAADTGAAGAAQRIFVTSTTTFTGEFAPGAGGADKRCASIAKSVNLPGTWFAVLSDATTNAKDRVTIRGRVVNMVGETVAMDAADMWNGTLAAPIRYDERGEPGGGPVWSSTNPDGTRAGTACASWSDQGNAAVLVGAPTATDSKWITSTQGACSDKAALYCLEQ